MSAPITITAANFDAEVTGSNLPIVVDFWATWCGPCKSIAPLLDEFAATYGDKVRVGKVNVDEQRELASAFQVRSIPTLAVIKDGEIAELRVGFKGRADLEALFKGLAGA